MKQVPYDVETGLNETKDLSIGADSMRSVTTISLDGSAAIKKTLSRAFLSSGMPVTFKVSHVCKLLSYCTLNLLTPARDYVSWKRQRPVPPRLPLSLLRPFLLNIFLIRPLPSVSPHNDCRMSVIRLLIEKRNSGLLPSSTLSLAALNLERWPP